MRDGQEKQQQNSRRQISLAVIAGATILSLIATQFACIGKICYIKLNNSNSYIKIDHLIILI